MRVGLAKTTKRMCVSDSESIFRYEKGASVFGVAFVVFPLKHFYRIQKEERDVSPSIPFLHNFKEIDNTTTLKKKCIHQVNAPSHPSLFARERPQVIFGPAEGIGASLGV